MKKLINLLAGVTLLTASVSPIVAWVNKPNSDQDVVNNIVKNIKDKNIKLAYGKGNYSTAANKAQLLDALLKENSGLTTEDEQYLNFPTSKTIAMDGTTAAVNVDLRVQAGSYYKDVILAYQVVNTWHHETNTGLGSTKFHYAPVKFTSSATKKPYYLLGSETNGLWKKDATTVGAQWTQVQATSGARTAAAPVKIGDTYYYATNGQGLWTTTDVNGTWTQSTAATTGIPATAKLLNAPTKIGNALFVGTEGAGMWTKPATGGGNWTQITAPGQVPANANVYYIAPDRTTGGTPVYYAATRGAGIYQATINPTTQAVTWAKIGGDALDDAGITSAPVYWHKTTYITSRSVPGLPVKGLWKLNAANVWTQADNHQFSAAPVKIGNIYYLPTVASGLYTCTDQTNLIRKWSVGIPTNLGFEAAPVKIGATYYLSSYGAGVWTSSDGKHWVQNKTPYLDQANLASAPVLLDGVYAVVSEGGASGATLEQTAGLWTIDPRKTN